MSGREPIQRSAPTIRWVYRFCRRETSYVTIRVSRSIIAYEGQHHEASAPRTGANARLSDLGVKILGLTVISALYYLGLSFALHPVTTPAQLEYDPNEYYTISSQQLHGDFVFNARRTPFYPLLLSLMRLLTGDHIVGTQLVGAFFFSLSAPLAYILVRKILRNDAIALTVAALVIIWPPYALFAGMLYSESAALPFFLAFLILLPRGSLLTAGDATADLDERKSQGLHSHCAFYCGQCTFSSCRSRCSYFFSKSRIER